MIKIRTRENHCTVTIHYLTICIIPPAAHLQHTCSTPAALASMGFTAKFTGWCYLFEPSAAKAYSSFHWSLYLLHNVAHQEKKPIIC